jgi:hypothetical protein
MLRWLGVSKVLAVVRDEGPGPEKRPRACALIEQARNAF